MARARVCIFGSDPRQPHHHYRMPRLRRHLPSHHRALRNDTRQELRAGDPIANRTRITCPRAKENAHRQRQRARSPERAARYEHRC